MKSQQFKPLRHAGRRLQWLRVVTVTIGRIPIAGITMITLVRLASRIGPIALVVLFQNVLVGCNKSSLEANGIADDRCGPNLHLTPTSNFCVSLPKELGKGTPTHFRANRPIRGAIGQSGCEIKKGQYVTLVVPERLQDGVNEATFVSTQGCIVRLKWRFLD